jgi:hypothetical protein
VGGHLQVAPLHVGAAFRRPTLTMKFSLATVLLVGTLGTVQTVQSAQTFTGVISDDMCELGDHSRMRMGANDAECTRACVTAHGAAYVLVVGKSIYTLSDEKTPEKFAGQRVRVVGTLNEKTKAIQVDSISAAK